MVTEQAAQGPSPPDLRVQCLHQIQANHEVRPLGVPPPSAPPAPPAQAARTAPGLLRLWPLSYLVARTCLSLGWGSDLRFSLCPVFEVARQNVPSFKARDKCFLDCLPGLQ